MLWLAGRVEVDRTVIVRAACACARTALRYVTDGETRPLAAIETAERWCDGLATVDAVRTAAYAAYAALAATYASAYAAAAYASAATYAASASAYAAAARTESRLQTADLVRELVTWAAVRRAMKGTRID